MTRESENLRLKIEFKSDLGSWKAKLKSSVDLVFFLSIKLNYLGRTEWLTMWPKYKVLKYHFA